MQKQNHQLQENFVKGKTSDK